MSDPIRRTILLGKGDLAIQIAEWFHESPGHKLLCVVAVMPEPTWTASLAEWASSRGVEQVVSGDYRDLAADQVDLAFSVFYDKVLSAAFIERCGRVLNLHNAPLPRYRGVAPINWALKNGERRHGVTIHDMTPGIDNGPIVSQVAYSIYPELDEVQDVYARALAFGYTLFEQTMPILDQIVPEDQDESDATYYSSRDRERLGDRRFFTRAESAPRKV